MKTFKRSFSSSFLLFVSLFSCLIAFSPSPIFIESFSLPSSSSSFLDSSVNKVHSRKVCWDSNHYRIIFEKAKDRRSCSSLCSSAKNSDLKPTSSSSFSSSSQSRKMHLFSNTVLPLSLLGMGATIFFPSQKQQCNALVKGNAPPSDLKSRNSAKIDQNRPKTRNI